MLLSQKSESYEGGKSVEINEPSKQRESNSNGLQLTNFLFRVFFINFFLSFHVLKNFNIFIDKNKNRAQRKLFFYRKSLFLTWASHNLKYFQPVYDASFAFLMFCFLLDKVWLKWDFTYLNFFTLIISNSNRRLQYSCILSGAISNRNVQLKL